jgi:site-specific DNA-methyltransferase (adenine-specific)
MFGENMRFDVIIGNPPYQLSDGGAGASATPIYHKFVEQAKKLEPRYLSFVIPSRWISGGKGLADFRNEMLNDERIEHITDYLNSKECFPGVSIGGGVCYFLWNRDYKGACRYINVMNKVPFELQRKLNEYPIFIRLNQAVSIVEKLDIDHSTSFSSLVSSRNPFGIASNHRGKEKMFKGSVALFSSDGVTYIKPELVTSGLDKLNSYKLMVGKIISEHAGEPDKNGYMKILSTIKLLKPNEVCTDSYLCIGNFKDAIEAENVLSYLKSKFARFLIMQAISSINLSKEKFYFVPLLNFSKTWDDSELYTRFRLSVPEIEFIESTIKEME